MRTTKILLSTFLVCVSSTTASADGGATGGKPGDQANATSDFHSYYFKQPQALQLDASRIAVFDDSSTVPAMRQVLLAHSEFEDVRVTRWHSDGWFMASLPVDMQQGESIEKQVERIAKGAGVTFVSPVFRDRFGGPLVITPTILVGFRQSVSQETAEAVLVHTPNVEVLERDYANMPGVYRLQSTSLNGLEVLATSGVLARHPDVEFAEPNMIFTGKRALIPNDPGFPLCWGLHNTGQTGGTVDMDMDAPEAWDITTGDPSVIVVVIDTGVQQDHPDINQIAGTDLTSDGGDGGPINVCDNHGTVVAGCVSATINNNLGTVGVAPSCKTASARTFISNLSCDGTWTSEALWTVDALAWAGSIGARVTNNSNSYGFRSSVIERKYEDTRAAGIVHFASAGNDALPLVAYPAAYPSVNAVAALDADGELAQFSNYGDDLAYSAPGVNIYSTDRTGSFGYGPGDYILASGTSFSSPYAAGVAALVISRDPDWSAIDVEEIIEQSATDLGDSGWDSTYGWGFVNARAALTLDPVFCGTFSNHRTFSGGLRPFGGCLADLDGDHDIDMAVADYDGLNVRILSNDGTGTFIETHSIVVGRAWAIAAGDLDNDNDEDLVVTVRSSNTVIVLINLGTGDFAEPMAYPVGDSPTSIVLADLDRDGDLDVVVGNSEDDNVAVLMNDGNGVLEDAIFYATLQEPHGVEVGDLDGRNGPDLATPHSEGLSILFNQGDGTFAPMVTVELPGRGGFLALGDIDNDCDLDMAVSLTYENRVLLMMNDGSGVFEPGPVYEGDMGPGAIELCHLTGDGFLDIVTGDSDAFSVSVYESVGNGTHAPFVSYPVGGSPSLFGGVMVADIDGDKDEDIAVVMPFNGDRESASIVRNRCRSGSGCERRVDWLCDGDVDGNGSVNPVDLGLVLANFCRCDECSNSQRCQYDMDCDGQVNPVDAGIVQSLFGSCETPRDVCP